MSGCSLESTKAIQEENLMKENPIKEKIEEEKKNNQEQIKVTQEEMLTLRMNDGGNWIEIKFGYGGINQLYGLKSIAYDLGEIENVQEEEFSLDISTDWIGPYMIRSMGEEAKKPRFTGGWHGSNGDGTGEKTAYTQSVTLYIEGMERILEEEILCTQLTLKVENYIYGFNVDQPILKEEVTYEVTNGNIQVKVLGTALEKLEIWRYYGLQTQNTLWSEKILYTYKTGEQEVYSGKTNSQAQPKRKNLVKEYKLESENGLFFLKVGMWEEGLGNFEFLQEDLPSCFTSDYGKSYFNLIHKKALPMEEQETFFWQGYYDFRKQGDGSIVPF